MMILAGKEIPNKMVEMYVRSIQNVRRVPTLAGDMARVEMHNRIIEEAGTTRHDHAFLGALSDAIYDLI